MEIAEIIGYCMAIVIGIIIGLVGGGGSIITVPVLYYLMGYSPVVATGYALFIIGVASVVGAANYALRKLVDFRVAAIFGIPQVIAVYATRKWFIPWLPENIGQIGSILLTKDLLLMIFLAVLVLAVSLSMIISKGTRSHVPSGTKIELAKNIPLLLILGVVIGFLTGLVGAGGGFMMIPALVLLVKLPMKQAIGTALIIATAKSSFGFLGEIGVNLEIDYLFLLLFTGLAIIGIFIGNAVSKKVPGHSLQKGFGWLILAVGVFIVVQEFLSFIP